ncbi:tetracycline efflux Na+/H+ antiporter family transporter Tet(35) [Lentibacillus populi]|uniref:Tetracycline efflux Na+/H+ antiporter family transporter Tet(35) n=1 Tax=Lentibacillus populi TaxID=1827502 RepID=A0A9W5TW86_9BACI|nr:MULTISPECIES: Na+/H+ antiporter NhaC family protein [Bacillaceae]MBT2217267.1 sodium:proton antiporter [Virgibacillus dakarensis]GGB38463.1 tetracycline efflux Na+/H+ antiporter family transporter Tet(35) [Lentibacillus populi]
MEHAWLSLLPFLIVIAMSIWLKEILPGLVLGIVVGAYFVEANLLGGTQQSVNYVVTTLTDESNIKIIAFLYLFGGLVGMMRISGGIKGFSKWVGEKIHSERGLIGLIWLTLPFTFMMPMFRTMMIGPVIKSILEKMKLSKSKIGFVLDVSTESVIVLLPVATAFVGFMISLVAGGIQKHDLSLSPYHIFLQSIPFNFFAIVMLVIGLIGIFWSPSRKKMEEKKDTITEDSGHDFHGIGLKKELSMVKAQPWNLIIPLFLLLGLTLFLLWQDGTAKGAKTMFKAFSMADATFVMLLAVFITLVLTFIFYMLRRLALDEILYHFIAGGNQLMQAIILLILVWSLSLVAEDLGFSYFISSTLGSFLPAFTVPAILFLVGAVVAYFIGSSWGTWGLFMPLGFSLATATGASIPLTVGAVFASGAFGAFTSPLGDTTITTASILELPLVDYAQYKLKMAAVGAGIACAGYLVVGLFFV